MCKGRNLAISELKKIRNYVSRQYMLTIIGSNDLDEAEAKGCNDLRADVLNEIDKQIKELKGK